MWVRPRPKVWSRALFYPISIMLQSYNMAKRLIKYYQVIQNITQDLGHKALLPFQYDRSQQKDIFSTVTESNVRAHLERDCMVPVYTLVKYQNVHFLLSQTKLLFSLKMLLDMRTLSRGGDKIFLTTKMMLFVTKVTAGSCQLFSKTLPPQMWQGS